jgi:ubiquitin carboxyl-terminal hydrolase L3
MGLDSQWGFSDCLGINEEALYFVSQPCFALLFLFPLTQIKAERRNEEDRIEKEGQILSEKLFFVKQHVSNACGTIAVIHAIANNLAELKIETGPIYDFVKRTINNNPEERGHLLGKDEAITRSHQVTSKMGATNPKDFIKSDFHFICFTMVDSHLYELDGSRKFPINHGPTTRQQMIKDAARVIKTNFVDKTPGELFFSLLTLGPAGHEVFPQEELEPQDDTIDISKVNELVSMGFPEELALTALKLKNNNTQRALDYLLNSNSEKTDIAAAAPSENQILQLMNLGFDRESIVSAFQKNNGNFDQTLNYLLG